VGWDFVTSLADVHLDDTLGVDRETLVRVDSHAEETGVGLLLLLLLFLLKKTPQPPDEIKIINSLAYVCPQHTFFCAAFPPRFLSCCCCAHSKQQQHKKTGCEIGKTPAL
jgi:hypothetical protein